MNGEGPHAGAACAEAPGPGCTLSASSGEPASTSAVSVGLGSTEQVSWEVAEWVQELGRFLGVVQAALEQSRPKDDASDEVRALSGQLPALIRQCRAQVPTPEMIRTWVKAVSSGGSDTPMAQVSGSRSQG